MSEAVPFDAADEAQLLDAIDRWVDAEVSPVVKEYDHADRWPAELVEQMQELGLFGELLVLNHLIGSISEHRAVDSWRGPAREEHDFGLGDFDIEVKTTLSEDRSHRISTLTQLQPSPARGLWLVSVQLMTRGVGGTTLAESIEQTANRLSDPLLRARFADRLTGVGWDPEQAHLYVRRFAQRGAVLAFGITDEFPAITAHRLGSAGFPIERFSHVSYVLHTAGLLPDAPPTELEGLAAP